jgi:hypothetical protein
LLLGEEWPAFPRRDLTSISFDTRHAGPETKAARYAVGAPPVQYRKRGMLNNSCTFILSKYDDERGEDETCVASLLVVRDSYARFS